MDHQIEDLSARQNFTMLPNCVMMWPGITHTALHLYLWYKMICGERPEGRCWTSLNTISEHCGMDRKTVISAREKLAEIGLIKVTKQRTSAGSEVVLISIVDVWDQNREWRFPDKQKDSVQEGGGKEPLTEQMGGGKLPLGGVENSHSNKTALNNTAINKTTEKKSSPFSADTCNSVDEQKQRIRSGRPEGSDGGGTNTLFGKDEDKTPYQYRKAEELHRALISKRKIFHRVSIQNWAEEFRKFLNTSSVTRKEFDETLSWYIEHIGEEFIPQAFAAESFVVKFVKIREQMLQSQPSKKLNGGIRADGSIDQDFVNRILERRAALGKP